MTWGKVRFLVYTILFIGGVAVSVLGHRIDGINGVVVMLLGPIMHLLLLYLYNCKYR